MSVEAISKKMKFNYAELEAIECALEHWGTSEKELRQRVTQNKEALWRKIRKEMPDLMQ